MPTYMRVRSAVNHFIQIALHFVQDTNTRFELAIECGNLDVAMETAKAINRSDCWERLAQQALKQGNHKVSKDFVDVNLRDSHVITGC